MLNSLSLRSCAALSLAAFVISASAAPSRPLPPDVQAMIISTFKSDDLNLSGAREAWFTRYDAQGALERFQCPFMAAYNFEPFHSTPGGGIVVGECRKDSQLNE